jgi:hypothetical protein
MQKNIQDLSNIKFSRNMRYDTVSIYDILIIFFSLISCHISILVDLRYMILAKILALWLA